MITLAVLGAQALGTGVGALQQRVTAARNRDRPQRRFRRNLLDNTDAPFAHQGHAHAPGGPPCDCREQQHPYAAVIERLLADPPLRGLPSAPGAPPAPPAPLEDSPLVWVADEAALAAMAAHLGREPRFALDVEHSPRAYHGITCLIQISTGACVAAVWSSIPMFGSAAVERAGPAKQHASGAGAAARQAPAPGGRAGLDRASQAAVRMLIHSRAKTITRRQGL